MLNYLSLHPREFQFKPNKELANFEKVELNTVSIGKYLISYSKNLKFIIADNLYCFILGDIYDYQSDEDILCIYKDNNVIKNIDGFFTLIFIHKDEIKIIADQSCLYPIYYCKEPFILSTIAYEIASFVKSYPNIEEINIYLCTGKTLHGNTIYKNIFELKSETVLTFDNNNSVHEYNYANDNDFIDMNIDINIIANDLKKIVNNGYRYLRDSKKYNNILCDLSGGADSRVTALLAKNFFHKIDIYTGGNNKEKQISNKIKSAYLSNSQYLMRRELQENVDTKVCNLVAGCDDYAFINKMYIVDKFESSKYDVKITGDAGSIFKDFWIKNIFPHKKLRDKGLSEKDFDFLILTRFLRTNPILKSYNETKKYIKENIKMNINFNLRKDKIIDQIFIKYHERSGKYVAKQISNLFYDIWPAFLTNKFILYCRKINPRFRFFDNIHSHIIFSINKLCSYIETDKSVFGFYPFKLVPKNKINIFYYAFWEILYNLQRATLKIFKVLKRVSKLEKVHLTQSKNNVQINKSLIELIPNITKLKDENLIVSLNFYFDYLNDS